MNVNIPSSTQPLVSVINGKVVNNSAWYRYFAQNDAAQIAVLKTTVSTQADQLAQQAADILALQKAVLTIRDVAGLNSLTSANEIPNLVP